MDSVCGRVMEEGEAGGGAGETDPFDVASAERLDFGVGVLFGEIEGVDVGFGGVEGHGESPYAAEGSCLEDFFWVQRADDGGEKGVRDNEAKAGEADGVYRWEDDLAGLIAAKEGRKSRVIDDRECIAGVEGVLPDAAPELDDVATSFRVCQANRCQLHKIAEHGNDVAGVDSVAARFWRRFFFHLDDLFVWSGLCGFSHTRWTEMREDCRDRQGAW